MLGLSMGIEGSVHSNSWVNVPISWALAIFYSNCTSNLLVLKRILARNPVAYTFSFILKKYVFRNILSYIFSLLWYGVSRRPCGKSMELKSFHHSTWHLLVWVADWMQTKVKKQWKTWKIKIEDILLKV